jgi:uncharacterized protein
LACHLLGIRNTAMLQESTFFGPMFESFVVAEIAKLQVNRGGRVELYYFRDQQGLEVDFIVPYGPRKLALIEAKASRTLTPAMSRSVAQLAAAINGYETHAFVVHGGSERSVAGRALSPGVSGVTVQEMLTEILKRI